MPRFACPQCNQVLTVDEEQRGTTIECAHCGRKMRVPAAKPAAAAAPSTAKSTRPDRPLRDDEEAAPRPRAATRRGDASDDDAEDHAPPRKAAGVRRVAAVDEDDESARSKKRRRSRNTSAIVGILSGIGGLIFIAIVILILTGKWVDLLCGALQDALESAGALFVTGATGTNVGDLVVALAGARV